MKTYYPINSKKIASYLLGLVAILFTSCGSYQNASYYDNDGVYGTSEQSSVQVGTRNSQQNNEKSNDYAQQFRAMQDDYSYFTDVNNYQSINPQDTTVVVYRDEYSNQNNAGWGNNASNVSINYIDNGWGMGWNNWGMGWNGGWGWNNWGIGWNAGWGWNAGFGWNNWWGPGWGLGWNNWWGPGWGWNNWGWNGYYGRNVAVNGGRRGGSGYYNSRSGRNATNYSNGRRANPSFNGTRNSNTRSSFQNPRTTQNNNPRATNTPRATTPRANSPRENNSVTPRSNNNYSTPRSSNFSTPRSSSGGFGGGGGMRSSGGGRGGRG